jgi:competence protein ComEA
VVHVSGAVAREGLVRLTPGSRVADAVAAAGGAAPAADLRRLNLAAKVLDGQQVAVPAVGEPPAAATASGGGGGSPSTDAPLDLNLATPAQLEALPGIGPSLARAIVAERERGGGFRSVDDLRRVRGIGDSRFSQLQPLVRV